MEKRTLKNTITEEQKAECLECSKLLEKYGINSIEDIKGCNLAEYLAYKNPDKYDNKETLENEELQKICAIINNKDKVAIMINLNNEKDAKYPYGDLAELKNGQIEIPEETEEKYSKMLKMNIEKMANGTLDAKKIEEIEEKMAIKSLDDIADNLDEEKTKSLLSLKIDEENKENGIEKEERAKYEEKSKEQAELEDKTDLPEDVLNACKKVGITTLKSYFYVNSACLGKKVEGTGIAIRK